MHAALSAHGGSRLCAAHWTDCRCQYAYAQEQEQFPARLDVDLMIDTLYGAVWYKVLIRFEKVTRTYIKKLVAQALDDDEG